MKTKRVKYLMVTLGMSFALMSWIPVQASEPEDIGHEEEISPQYVTLDRVNANLSISGGNANCTGSIILKSKKACSVTIALQKILASNT